MTKSLSGLALLCAFTSCLPDRALADMPHDGHCNALTKDSKAPLHYVEGQLVKHFPTPDLACECTEQPMIYWLTIKNDQLPISSAESTVSAVFYMHKPEADALRHKLRNGAMYGFCGSITYPDSGQSSKFAIPVIEGIISSLQEIKD
jgi:hypothetical protein